MPLDSELLEPLLDVELELWLLLDPLLLLDVGSGGRWSVGIGRIAGKCSIGM